MASVECSVCFNEFRDPRVLSCGHTFCLQCIEGLTRANNTLKCPQCRKVHAGFTTAAAMPRNVTANDLIEALQRTRLSAANTSDVAVAATLNGDGNKNLIPCKECSRNYAIDDFIFCTNHNFYVCAKCCLLKHKQCDMVDGAEHSCTIILENKVSLENAQRALDKSSERLAQDSNRTVTYLKQWADALSKAQAIYERTGQLVQKRLRDLSEEVSSHRGLLADFQTNKENAPALLYSVDWANTNNLVAKCAVYTEVDLVKLAGFAEDNIVWNLGNLFPEVENEFANINVDERLRQIEDQLNRTHGGHQTSQNVPVLERGTVGTITSSFCVLDWNTNGFIRLNKSRSAWIELSPMPEPKREYVSVAAYANTLYVVGGVENVNGWATSRVQKYDTQTGWQDWPQMQKQREGCGAAALGGRLFVVGGRENYSSISSVEECDLMTGRWVDVAPMRAGRYGVGVAALGNLLIVVGGSSPSFNSAECYDPRTGRWTIAAPMQEPRGFRGCAALGERLYVAGGYVGGSWTASVECFDLRVGKWTHVREMSAARAEFALATLNGQLLAAGGSTSGAPTVEVYDENRDAWSTLNVRLPRDGRCVGCALELQTNN